MHEVSGCDFSTMADNDNGPEISDTLMYLSIVCPTSPTWGIWGNDEAVLCPIYQEKLKGPSPIFTPTPHGDLHINF